MFISASDTLSFIFFLSMIQNGMPQYEYEPSPCPNIFIYQYNQQIGLYGQVQIAGRYFNTLQLNIELAVGNVVQGYNGNIELAKPKEEIIQDVLKNTPILYKVFFPAWRNIPPKITKIIVNGNLICTGPTIPINLVPIITTINLHHTLKLDVLPLSFPKSSRENIIFSTGGEVTRSDSNRFNPQVHGLNLGPYSYRPESSSGNDLEFKPNHPRDSSSIIYPGNEFTIKDENRPIGFQEQGEIHEQPLGTKNVFLDFDPGYPRPKINRTNPFLGTPSEHEYRPGGIFKEMEDDLRRLFPDSTTDPPLRHKQIFDFHPGRPRPNANKNIQPSGKPPDYPYNYQSGGRGVNINQPTSTHSSIDDSTELVPKRDSISTEIPQNVHNDFFPNEPYASICGKPVSTNSLVTNGNEVPRGAYPWLAAMFGVRPTGLNYMCSASLISDRHVVTAAHCLKKEHKSYRPNDLLIILGKSNIQKWVPSYGEKMIEVESIHIHPEYKDFTSDADVAVLILNEKVEFTKFIRPLCIWSGNSQLERIIGVQGTVVGWGKDENGILMTAEPKQIRLPIVSQETCLRSSYQFQYITSNRTFCAGFRNGTGPCNGDSGSGFIIQQRGKWTLRGVVSMSISDNHSKTCDLSNYVVFTDASKFTKWILTFII